MVWASNDDEFAAAKRHLMTTEANDGVSLYQHLTDIIANCMNENGKIVDVEQLSGQLKLMKYKHTPVHLFLPLHTSSGDNLHTLTKMKVEKTLFDNNTKHEHISIGGAREELFPDVEQEKDMFDSSPDLMETAYLLEKVGVGLSRTEFYRIHLSLLKLKREEPLASVRFWGKMLGLRANYLIVECKLNNDALANELAEVGGHHDEMEEMEEGGEHIVEDGYAAKREQTATKEDDSSKYCTASVDMDDTFTDPLPPPMTPEQPPLIAREKTGEGCNMFVYYVCSEPGEPWRRLPNVTPEQILTAQAITKLFTGDLDQKLICLPTFPGTERGYLRAQIARISAATHVSPRGYFSVERDYDIDEDDDGFQTGGWVEKAADFEGLPVTELLDTLLTGWVHHRSCILSQGRTSWFDPQATNKQSEEHPDFVDFDDANDEEEREDGPQLLASLCDDKIQDGLQGAAWTPGRSVCPILSQQTGLLQSNTWPGAYAIAAQDTRGTGTMFANIYIGWGKKYGHKNFNPPEPLFPHEEYSGPRTDVTEVPDPTVAYEQAYKQQQRENREGKRRERQKESDYTESEVEDDAMSSN